MLKRLMQLAVIAFSLMSMVACVAAPATNTGSSQGGTTGNTFVSGVAKDDDAAAQQFLLAVLNNVTAMDKGARKSITNFEKGVGDVAITYENEVLVGQKNGQDYELVIPPATILIENPVAVVDSYADKQGTHAAAEALVNFLYTKETSKSLPLTACARLTRILPRRLPPNIRKWQTSSPSTTLVVGTRRPLSFLVQTASIQRL